MNEERVIISVRKGGLLHKLAEVGGEALIENRTLFVAADGAGGWRSSTYPYADDHQIVVTASGGEAIAAPASDAVRANDPGRDDRLYKISASEFGVV